MPFLPNTPLLYVAIGFRHYDIVPLLLNAGAAIEESNAYGMRSIHLTVCQSKMDRYRRGTRSRSNSRGRKVDRKMSVDPIYADLWPVSEQEDISLLGTLLESKADLKARDNHMWTVLHYAIHRRRSETVKFLLNRSFINGWFASEVQREQPKNVDTHAGRASKNPDFLRIALEVKTDSEQWISIFRDLASADAFVPPSLYFSPTELDRWKDLESRYPDLKPYIARIA